MEKKKLRVGIVGMGNWAVTAHIPAFLAIPDSIEIVAVCNHNLEKAEQIAKQFNIAGAYSNTEEMIIKENLDILDIVTSRGTHFEPAKLAIEHGIDILSEKPIGHSLEEAEQLVEMLNGKDIVTHVGFTFRYSPVVRQAKKMIDNGELGRILHIQAFEQNGQLVDEEKPLPRIGFSKKTDSGALHGFGSHLIDLCRLLFGEIDNVIGHEQTYIKNRRVRENLEERMDVTVDDSTMWMCNFESGAQGLMQASKVAIGNAPGIEIRMYGTKAALWIRLVETKDGYDKMWIATKEDMDFKPLIVHGEVGDTDWPVDYFKMLVKDFSERVQSRNKNTGIGDFKDGLKCQQIMGAIEKSFETKTWVKVDEI